MADPTTPDRTGAALVNDSLDIIVRLPAGSDRMGAVVAGFTIQPTMPGRLLVELAGILSMRGIVAIPAARQIYPGRARAAG